MQHELRVWNVQVWSSALKLETLVSDNHHKHSFCAVQAQDYFYDNTSRTVDMKTWKRNLVREDLKVAKDMNFYNYSFEKT